MCIIINCCKYCGMCQRRRRHFYKTSRKRLHHCSRKPVAMLLVHQSQYLMKLVSKLLLLLIAISHVLLPIFKIYLPPLHFHDLVAANMILLAVMYRTLCSVL